MAKVDNKQLPLQLHLPQAPHHPRPLQTWSVPLSRTTCPLLGKRSAYSNPVSQNKGQRFHH